LVRRENKIKWRRRKSKTYSSCGDRQSACERQARERDLFKLSKVSAAGEFIIRSGAAEERGSRSLSKRTVGEEGGGKASISRILRITTAQ